MKETGKRDTWVAKCPFIWRDFHIWHRIIFQSESLRVRGTRRGLLSCITPNHNHSGVHGLTEPILLPCVITLEVTLAVFFRLQSCPVPFHHIHPSKGASCSKLQASHSPPPSTFQILHQNAADAIVTSQKIQKISSSVPFTAALIHSVLAVPFFSCNPEQTLPLVFECIHGVSVEAYGLTCSKQRSTLIHPSRVGSTRPSRSVSYVLLDRQVHTAW